MPTDTRTHAHEAEIHRADTHPPFQYHQRCAKRYHNLVGHCSKSCVPYQAQWCGCSLCTICTIMSTFFKIKFGEQG